MEKIRVIPKNLYIIEVNDNGDTIEFDMDDLELVFKLERAYKAVKEAQKELKVEMLIIEKKKDTIKKDEMLSANEKARIDAYKKTFIKMRQAFDEFLGQGACQKIFGDRNYLEMFDDLIEQLNPHFEKMKLNRETVMKKIKDKYKIDNDEDVLK